jgi:hyperosmotically inducible periplasmic protein
VSAMRQIQNLIILILAALTLAGAAGVPSSPPDLNTGGDDWVTVKARTALYRDLRYMGHRLSVETAQGVVTLRGKVDSEEDKAAAVEIVRSIDGVRDIRSDLTVVPPAQRTQVEATDEQIGRLIKDQLKRDPQLRSERIDAWVDVGVVTLTGEVNSSAASNRASEIARGVPGVRDVKNELVDLAQPRLKDTSRPSRRRSGTSSGG